MKYQDKIKCIVAAAFIGMPAVMNAQDLDRGDGAVTEDVVSVTAFSNVDMDKVGSYTDLQLSNTLHGLAAGLVSIPGTGGLGDSQSTLYVRGQHSIGSSAALIIVDGMERSIDDLLAEEIESITVLKDASAKAIYGARGANGVVLVKTKRGVANSHVLKANVEYGIQPTTRLPKFLGAYDYATLYNEACQNDGLMPYYSATELEGYKHSKGENDFLYPDANFYDRMLNSQNSIRKANIQLLGGNNTAQYAVTAAYTGASGLEAVGDKTGLNRLNVRGNLDIRINDFMKVVADVAGRIEKKDWGAVDNGTLFSTISTLRPNEYPFVISPEDVNGKNGYSAEEGDLIFGASNRKSNNIFAQMQYGGNTSERYVNSQTNIGLDFDFNKYVEGLTAAAFINFDNYSYLRQSLRNQYTTYSIDRFYNQDGELDYRLTQRQELNLPKSQSISSEQTYRSLGFRGNVGYDKTIGLHSIGANLAFRYTKIEQTGSSQDIANSNLSLRLNYDYAKKYLAEVILNNTGSNRFGDKHFVGYALGAGWVLSNEEFLRGNDVVNFLKLKASYGVLGYDGSAPYFYDLTRLNKGSNLQYNPGMSGVRVDFARYGNPDMKWESTHEFNIGVETSLLGNRLQGEINFFREMRKNIIGVNTTSYTAAIGTIPMYDNVADVRNTGIELELRWNDKVGEDFTYSVGLNAAYNKNKVTRASELYENDYRKSVGHSTSTIFGFESEGLFGVDADINNHAHQTLSAYQNGDIAYKDLNGDGKIDDNDRQSIGQSFPTTTFGITVDLKYKGFGLYILGTATTGITKNCNNAYYWNYGQNSYSELALDRYHEVNNPNGTQPRLTTTSASNNFQNSTFWAKDGSFFRLKNVELSYTLINKFAKPIGKEYKFFVRANNLFVLSGIKDLDPEMINAGISNYPVGRTISAGVSVAF